jgi:2-keto-3-deoxy-L-rhamnonate aldolase RhmA
MRANNVKQHLKDGCVALGTFVVEFPTVGIGRIATLSGAEFVLFDMEHTSWTFETIAAAVAGTKDFGAVPLVRVPSLQRSYLSRSLDVGAMGIMVPMVRDATEAEHIVKWAKYPPKGVRGACFGQRRDNFKGGDILATMDSANEEGLLIAQIETVEGLSNVDEIAAVEGIDVLWVGQFDLTISMGIAGQFRHSDYVAALEKVVSASELHGKAAGFLATSLEEAKEILDRGFRCVSCPNDISLYMRALDEMLGSLRRHVSSAGKLAEAN